MKRALTLLAFLTLTGCAGRYTVDMSGLDQASEDYVEPRANRYTMPELDEASERTLGDTADKMSMSELNDLSSDTFDPYTRGRKGR